MSTKVERNYLEINSLKDLKKSKFSPDDCLIDLSDPADFQINKFFYKSIGEEHRWTDRLVWTDKQWMEYISDQKVKTYILKKANDMAGYFELIFHKEKKETEIAYLGLLKEYQNKKLGSFLLTSAIKNSFFNILLIFKVGTKPTKLSKMILCSSASDESFCGEINLFGS